MLPEDFQWVQRAGETGPDRIIWLYCGKKKAVASVMRRLDGRWYTLVNRHRPPHLWLTAFCANQAQGMRWVERWAAKHAERLREEPHALDSPEWWEGRG